MKIQPTFQQALDWHRNGKMTSPNARSAVYTDAILSELDEAIQLLQSCVIPEVEPAIAEFLHRHPEAPYIK